MQGAKGARGHFQVLNRTRGKVLADRAQTAGSFISRLLGLMGRAHFPEGEALHLSPCNGVHTFFMRLPIDVLVLDGERRVLKALAALPPWRATPLYPGARSVLELPAGVIQASGTAVGDQLDFQDAPGQPGVF